MTVWNTIRTWFFENVWPLIQSFLNVVIEKTLEWISEQVNQLLDDYAQRFSQKAKDKAVEELKKADQVQDDSEADKHRAVAEVWKKVSADIMEENSRIKGKLADVFLREKAAFAARIESLKPDDVFENLSGKEVKLKIGGTNLIVPVTILRKNKEEEAADSM